VPIANVPERLCHRAAHTTAKIYQHALPNTDQDVAATWDRLIEKAEEKAPGTKRHNSVCRKAHNRRN
jgi:hypothetical protein